MNAFVVTNTAAAMAALAWVTAAGCTQRPSVIGAAAGAVAGLVAITPAAGFVSAQSAIIIGGVAGVVCYAAAQLKYRLRVDDALDVWAVHGVGGGVRSGRNGRVRVGGRQRSGARRVAGRRAWPGRDPAGGVMGVVAIYSAARPRSSCWP